MSQNEKRIKELEGQLDDVCCDLQEGATYGPKTSAKIDAINSELNALYFIVKSEEKTQ
jgi:hypothetical protein